MFTHLEKVLGEMGKNGIESQVMQVPMIFTAVVVVVYEILYVVV